MRKLAGVYQQFPLWFSPRPYPRKNRPFLFMHLRGTHFATFLFSNSCMQWGGVPPSGSPSLKRDPLVPKSRPLSPSFQVLAHSFALFCTHQELNPFLFKDFRTLCANQGVWGVMANQTSNKGICPPCPDLVGEHLGEEHRDGGISLPRATEHGSRFSVALYLVASLLHYVQPATNLR